MAAVENYGEETGQSEITIADIVQMDNVAPYVAESELTRIGMRVCEEYDIDRKSMQDWIDRNELAQKLIDQKQEQKTEPWPGAANTKLPLVLNAAMRISAEEYAEIMRSKELVQCEIFGVETPDKIARSTRVSSRMNYQYQNEMEGW